MALKRTIVIVDDEPHILSALKRAFFDEDYRIETFKSGEDALEYVMENDVQIIITDQRMPGMSGSEFLKKARGYNPTAIHIVLTAITDIDAVVDTVNIGQIYRFIFKPWEDEDLRAIVKQAFEFYDLDRENERLLAELLKKNAELAEWNQTLNAKVKARTSVIVQRNLELGQITKKLENSLMNTILVFNKLVELVNPEMSTHSRRVASIATMLADTLEFSDEQIQNIEIAALLHDIGKLGIPKSILAKPEEMMTESDRDLIIYHPIQAQNTLLIIEHFSEIGRIIRHHHEHWDGSGYPDGLKKEEIPIESRLISICNVYDHMVQEGRTRSETFLRKYFYNNSGIRFDPAIVKVLINFISTAETEKKLSRQVNVIPSELEPGMVLTQDLNTEGGIFLLPRGQLLTKQNITTIQEFHQVDPVVGSIQVVISLGKQ